MSRNKPRTRKNVTQPSDWWASFERAAKEEGVTLSEWLGDCMLANLPKEERERLSKRPGIGRPRQIGADNER